jgi:hypothetical protein
MKKLFQFRYRFCVESLATLSAIAFVANANAQADLDRVGDFHEAAAEHCIQTK